MASSSRYTSEVVIAKFPPFMRVLLYHFVPFALAHGGQQIQLIQTRDALRRVGVDAEFLDWHREDIQGDILHFFGRLPVVLQELARQKGLRIVISDLLAGQGARAPWRLQLERYGRKMVEQRLPGTASWSVYRRADACVALTSWEARLLQEQFSVPPGRIHVVPNGVEEVFLESAPVQREPWLLCVATVTRIKRVVELAQAAVLARVPIRFVGKPYSAADPYAREFGEVVQANPDLLKYEGPVNDRGTLAELYRKARGFVLLSAYESLSLAALEAAACECPLLLSDLPWARAAFEPNAAFCGADLSPALTAAHLRAFYENADSMPKPPRPLTWLQVAKQLEQVYQGLKT